MADRLTRYALGGHTIASAFALPELPPARDRGAEWTVAEARKRPAAAARWFHHWTDPRGRPWLSIGRSGSEYVLRFTRLGSFRVSVDARTVLCERVPAVPAHTTRHLLLNQVLPLAFGTEQVVLHAGAVAMPGGAVVFAGRGRAGKSTLVAALARRGHPLLADDAVRVTMQSGRHVVHPGYPSVRLWPDVHRALLGAAARAPRAAHYTQKRRVAASGLLPFAEAPTPVMAICLIDSARRTRHVSMAALSAKDSVLGLLPLTFQLDIRHAGHQRRTIDDLADLVERVPVVSLSYPRQLGKLPGVVDEIERWAGESGGDHGGVRLQPDVPGS